MKNNYFILRIIYTILLSVIFSGQTYAGPVVNICVNNSCKNKASIEVSNKTWKSIKDIYATPFPTDKDEQDNIITSFTLIRADVYNTLAHNNSLGADPTVLYETNSVDINYKNAKNLLGVLLDNHLIKRHYLRKTIKASSWSKAFSWSGISNMTSVGSTGLLFQSLTDSKQYIFEIDSNALAESASITPYSN